jgi:hypothetical protein
LPMLAHTSGITDAVPGDNDDEFFYIVEGKLLVGLQDRTK